MTDSTLLLLAFGVFSTALVLIYLLALWTRPVWAWLATLGLGVAAIACVMQSERLAQTGIGDTPGVGALILSGIFGIATMGGLIGAAYGTWRVSQR